MRGVLTLLVSLGIIDLIKHRQKDFVWTSTNRLTMVVIASTVRFLPLNSTAALAAASVSMNSAEPSQHHNTHKRDCVRTTDAVNAEALVYVFAGILDADVKGSIESRFDVEFFEQGTVVVSVGPCFDRNCKQRGDGNNSQGRRVHSG
jgi:hypothetical protein